MNGFKEFEGFAYGYLNANHFDPETVKQSLGRKPEPDRRLRAQFKRVLEERPYTFETWEGLTAVSLDTDEELYDHLRQVYRYLFDEGPYPTWGEGGVMVDLRTEAWLDDMFIYGGGNVYGPPQLKEEIDARGEWAERFRSNFDHVLAERELTALEYEDRTEISFDTDVEFYDYLAKLHHFIFSDGPMP